MATAKNPAKSLLGSFKELGLTAAQVRHFLPAWWDDEVASDDSGLLELQMLLARRLNVSLDSLQASAPKPVFRAATRRFKTAHPDGSTQLAVAAGVGHGLAQLLAACCPTKVFPQPLGASVLRASILNKHPTVTLEAICLWLWDHGVPVVHIQNWPKQLRRPDAMCVRVNERPVVLAVRNDSTLARLTYLVAHEVGHIMLGHLRAEDNAVLVDDTLPVDEGSTSKDADEKAADAFAMELLGGEALRAASRRLGPHAQELKLAAAASTAGRGTGLDAGQIVLGWARLHGDWKLAAKAMWYLTTTQAAPVVVNDVAKRYIDTDAVSVDAQEHLEQLTGMRFQDE